MADEEQILLQGNFLLKSSDQLEADQFSLDGRCEMCRLSQSNLANSVGTVSIPDSDGIVFTQLCCCL